MMLARALFVYLMWLSGAFAAVDTQQPLTLDQCIEIALRQNTSLEEAQASIEEYRARLAQVESVYYPKLTLLSYVSPMFTVHGDALSNNIERRYNLGSWGPSTHLETVLALPIYTFGRVEAGKQAAQARLNLERSRLAEAQNHVKVEVSKLYYTHLYAQSMLPDLQRAKTRLDEVQTKAREFYDQARGNVSKADLMRLEFAATELEKYFLLATEGASLSLTALKHAMGLDPQLALHLQATEIPSPPASLELEDMDDLLTIAKRLRPEWEQIRFGMEAAQALRQSERNANRPTVFVAGSLEADWTPSRDDANNPYHYDPYNEVFGGVAVGIKWDLDWAMSKAKADAAHAQVLKVTAKQRQALTGIPLQIEKARSELQRFYRQTELAAQATKAATKWIVFSNTAYTSGTGEVKEVLEGLAALIKSRRDYNESVMQFYIARSELDYAVGR